jgi:hypothetical protein
MNLFDSLAWLTLALAVPLAVLLVVDVVTWVRKRQR